MSNFDDLYAYVEERDLKDKNFKSNIRSLYLNNAKWIFPFYDILSSIIFFWLRPTKKKKYFFLGTRFTHLIAALSAEEVCIIGGPKQLLYCLRNNIDYIPNGVFWTLLSKGFMVDNIGKIKQTAYKHSKLLGKIHDDTQQALMIVENDSLPIQRLYCNIAAESHIKTVCIQHGLFQSKTDPKTIDGWKCDYFICYDDKQKEVLSGLGIDGHKVMIGGFYEPIIQARTYSKNFPLKVCFLGQPWFKYGDVYKNKYQHIVNVLSSSLGTPETHFYFKPHPWEKDAEYLKNMSDVFMGSMQEAIERYDVFFSFTSTALLEVTMAGKVAIQIYDDLFACDNFESLGYAYTVKSDELKKYIPTLLRYTPYPLELPSFDCLVNQVKSLTKVIL